MDYSSKDDFYKDLIKDYNNHHTNSFLYKYFESRKDKNLGFDTYLSNKEKSRKDYYVYIRSCYTAYRDKEIGKEEFAGVLEETAGDLNAEEIKKVLNKGSVKASKSQLMEELMTSIENELRAKTFPTKGVTIRLIEALSSKYIESAIRDYLYNVGYDKKGERAGQGEKAQRRSDDALDMLFEYQQHKIANDSGIELSDRQSKSKTLYSPDKLKDKDYIEECETLYKILNESDDDCDDVVFVPVVIDPDTGLGIYIIGGDILEKKDNDNNNCYYCCIRFDHDFYDEDYLNFGEYIKKDPFVDDEVVHRFKLPYLIDNEGGKYTDIQDAIDAYNRLIREEIRYSGYINLNEPRFEEIMDSNVTSFYDYFASQEDEEEIREDKKNKLEQYQKKRDNAVAGERELEKKRKKGGYYAV